ncbi:MAG: hypothetical protein IT436_12735 [Phycisphaerales bacterium]|nr:hypothetical protein [Phycisphaerales bacterium]
MPRPVDVIVRPLARIIAHPALCALCGVLLFVDWAALPDSRSARSTAARWFPFVDAGTTGCVFSFPIELSRSPAGLHAVYRTEKSVPIPSDRDPIYGVSIWRARSTSAGFWGLTSKTESLTIYGADSLASEDRPRLLPALLALYDAAPDLHEMDPVGHGLLRSNLFSRTTTLRAGYLHNALAIALGVLFLAGLPRSLIATARRIATFRGERRSERRLAHGLCPPCGYDLRGEFEAGCPECGWNRPET